MEEYDPIKDEWRLVAPMNVKRSRVALCANMGKLWAIGGKPFNIEYKPLILSQNDI